MCALTIRELISMLLSQGDNCLGMVPLTGYSYFLFGREARVGELLGEGQLVLLSDPTSSGQHAGLQFRSTAASSERVTILRDDAEAGDEEAGGGGLPYLVDLFSTNGSWLNGKRMEPNVYYRLKLKDTLRFGLGNRCCLVQHHLLLRYPTLPFAQSSLTTLCVAIYDCRLGPGDCPYAGFAACREQSGFYVPTCSWCLGHS